MRRLGSLLPREEAPGAQEQFVNVFVDRRRRRLLERPR